MSLITKASEYEIRHHAECCKFWQTILYYAVRLAESTEYRVLHI